MPSPLRVFAQKEQPVLSLAVLAASSEPERKRSHFEVLVRHLLQRFFSNELLATDEETLRAMRLGYMVALPGMLFALYLFPSYHAVPIRRTFWPQVSDHYFYVTYSLVVMGIVAVYEWDLLFPDLLDVLVLSTLPISAQRLFLARVVAVSEFLGLVVAGTNGLGCMFLPMVADLPHPVRHFIAHTVAVTASGVFTAALCLVVLGLLLNLLSANLFRRIVPFVQGVAVAMQLTVLFLIPLISHALQQLLTSGNSLVYWFPPLWFLGIYQTLLGGSSTMPVFVELARTGCWATSIVLLVVLASYPLAYKRRLRQLIEGPGTSSTRLWRLTLVDRILRATILRQPAARAIFYFISQTFLRTRRHRIILAMFGGLAIAMTIADMLLLRLGDGHIRISFSPEGIRSAIPVSVFWLVVGLRTGLTAPVDRRSSWIFRVVVGRPSLQHLNGAKIWVAWWGLAAGLAAALLLRGVAPAALRSPLATLAQVTVAVGCSLLLTEFQFFSVLALPFTEIRRTSITDLPLLVVRYFVLFPVLVLTIVRNETWLEAGPTHLALAALSIIFSYLIVRWFYRRRVKEMRSGSDYGDSDDAFLRMGLAD
jgi:hypothetical protein